jgi:hypothetical protein
MVPLYSTCYKVSNDILFVIFRVVDWKIWFLQVSNKIWFQNSNLNSICTADRHMVPPHWRVPIRVDPRCEPSDFIRSEWLGSADTCSLKWFNLIPWIQIGRCTTTEGGAHRLLGLRRGIPARCGLGSSSGEAPVVSWGKEEDDGTHHD